MRFDRIESLWRDNETFCRHVGREVGWTYLALWAAEYLRKGETLVPPPPTDDILASYDSTEGFGRWDAEIGLIINHRMGTEAANPYPETMDEFRWNEALTFHRTVRSHFPSVNWLLPERHKDRIIETHEAQARSSMERLCEVRNLAPPDPSSPGRCT